MKTAFIFSGQGAQYPGMMKELYDSCSCVKEVYRIAEQTLGRDIRALSFEGTQEELNLTHNTQVCILAADLSSALTVSEYGVKADAAAGFSVGEYAALTFAGCISMEDAFRLVQLRADAMQAAVPVGEGAMAAFLRSDAETVEKLCREVRDEYVVPANYNSPTQTVVAGTRAGINAILKLADERELLTAELPVSAPFHCELMKPAAEIVKQKLNKITFKQGKLPVYMNADSRISESVNEIKENMYLQAFRPVLWKQTIERMYGDGIHVFVECEFGKSLSNMVKKTLKNVIVCNVETEKTLEHALHKVEKANESEKVR